MILYFLLLFKFSLPCPCGTRHTRINKSRAKLRLRESDSRRCWHYVSLLLTFCAKTLRLTIFSQIKKLFLIFFRTFANPNECRNGKTTHQSTCCTSSKNREQVHPLSLCRRYQYSVRLRNVSSLYMVRTTLLHSSVLCQFFGNTVQLQDHRLHSIRDKKQ